MWGMGMTYSVRSESTRAVVSLDGVDRVAFNEDGSMELLTPAANPTGNKVPTAGQLPFTKSFESAGQTISNAGQLTLPHGLGVAPKLVQLLMVCKTAELGYSTGDVVAFYECASGNPNDGMSVIYGTANIVIRYGAVTSPTLIHATTGAVTRVTSANWRLVVRAWA